MRSIDWKRALAVLGFFVLLVCAERVVSYFVLPLHNARVPAQQERAELEGTIDTLLLGASLTGDAVNSPMLEQRIGGTVFNMASNAQSTRLSYYALMDVVDGGNPLDTCLIEVSLRRLSRDGDEEGGLGRIAFSDYLMHARSRLLFMRENYTLDDLPRVLVMSIRCQLNFFRDGLAERLTGGYLSQILRQGYALADDGSSIYAGRGYVAQTGAVHNGFMTADPTEPSDLTDVEGDIGKEGLEEVRRAVALCQENGINPILFSTPIPDARIQEYQGCYERLTEIIQGLADEMDVPFYDFNYSKRVRASIRDDQFKDEIHMNTQGAEMFTPVLADAIQNGVGEDEFYGSFDEMLNAIERVGGVSCKRVGEAVEAWCFSSPDTDVEYRFFIRPSGTDQGQNRLIQDWSPSDRAPLADIAPGKYWVRVEARDSAHPERGFDAFARLEVTLK